MSKYNTKTNYRKIYEQHHGPIPKDEQGMSFDIHHIDGDRTNNDPSNLRAVSLQEHLDIHLAQGDWGAAQAIYMRMLSTPEQRSAVARELALARVEDGTHNFLDRDAARDRQLKRVAAKTHHFLGGDLQHKRLADGTHNFVCNNPVFDQIAAGQNKLYDKQWQKDKAKRTIEHGKHNFLSVEFQEKSRAAHKKRIAEGHHHTQQIFECPKCGHVGKGPNMQRYHFNNCIGSRIKEKGPHPATILRTCPHCGTSGKGGAMLKHHFERCKRKSDVPPQDC
jgi:rubrerythrin